MNFEKILVKLLFCLMLMISFISCALSVHSPGPQPGSPPPIGEDTQKSTESSNKGLLGREIKLAVKFVSYLDRDNQPIISQAQVSKVIQSTNDIYRECEINFILEEYLPVAPKDRNLSLNPSSMTELQAIRDQFDEPKRLLVVTTGSWDRSSGLGANAWTATSSMMLSANELANGLFDPPEAHSPRALIGASGTVVEAAVATQASMIAHELGHYLGLDHFEDSRNLMNPMIFASSTGLLPSQCATVRESAVVSRSGMIR